MEEKKIFVTRSSMPSFEEYCNEIHAMWDNRWLSNGGQKHKDFQKLLGERMNQKNVFLYANGHVALEVGLDALELPKGGEVITTPYTHCSTTHSIVRNGLKPVFCDINATDYCIDATKIEELVTPKTVAIMATHVYGTMCDVETIQRLAEKHNLKVIYDAAHAFGVTKDGKDVASWGDMVMFSCHATKVFHTIEGGITVMRDDEVQQKLEMLVNFGFVNAESVRCISTNARMNEFECAMGICNLRHFEEEVSKRETAYRTYRECLDGVDGIRFIADQAGITKNYSYMPVFFDGYKYDRNTVQKLLAENGIFARKYFYPLVPDLEAYNTDFCGTDYPVAYHAAETVLCLPMYADLSADDVKRICSIILK